MTAIIAHQFENGNVVIWHDDESFAEDGTRWPAGRGKVRRQAILNTAQFPRGRSLVAHAGDLCVEQFILWLPMPSVNSDVSHNWEPDDDYMSLLSLSWYESLKQRGLWNDEGCTLNGADEWLIALKGHKTSRLYHMGAGLEWSRVEGWGAIGCAGAMLLGAVSGADEAKYGPEARVKRAYEIARRHYAHVGAQTFKTDLEG